MHPRLLLPLLLALLPLRADVALAPLFQDHAVLQRDQPLPVWGTARPGETVVVRLVGQTASTTAGADGRWSVRLAPMPANATPAELVVQGDNVVTVSDVLLGDVWLLSGQSNMEWPVRASQDAATEIAAATDSRIRHFATSRTLAHQPQAQVRGAWAVNSPATVGHFSAVGYFFARELRREIDVPIGLLHSSWGGTPVESWLPPEELSEYPVRRMAIGHHAHALQRFARELASHEAALTAWRQAGAVPPAPNAPWVPGPEIAPGLLFNGMIAPHVPAALRGVLWYQGEANADQPETYETMFRALISAWRRQFDQPKLPFYWVQLANWNRADAQGTGWAQLRDAQTAALALPQTGQAIAIDIGDPDDIHPRNKQDVGRRLARIALAEVYGHRIAFTGPTFAGLQREGDALRVVFDHAAGLHGANGAPPQGFEIAGADRVFHPAAAEVQANAVVLRAPGVTTPVAVRYAWRNSPVATLRNGEGLPAVPFRSDDWPVD